MRQNDAQGEYAQDRQPDHPLSPDPITNRAADDGADSERGQEHEQQNLRLADADPELRNEIERVVAGKADQVDEFRKHQRDQH